MPIRPTRLPTFAGAEPPVNARVENTALATGGYGKNATPTSQEWNWLNWTVGEWTRHFHTESLRTYDVWDVSATVWRTTGAAPGLQIGGPLSQVLNSGAVYLWEGKRLEVDPSLMPALVFPPSATSYVHIRPNPDPVSRDVLPEFLVSGNSSEAGYATILQVITSPFVVSGHSESSSVVAGLGVETRLSFAKGLDVPYTGLTSASALSITVPPMSAPALEVAADSANTATLVNLYSGQGPTIEAESEASSALEATGNGADPTISATATDSGPAILATASGTGPQIRMAPKAAAPAPAVAGDFYLLSGEGPEALRYHEGARYYIHASRDGVAPATIFNTGASLFPPSTGPTTVATLNYLFRNGGLYKVEFNSVYGGGPFETTFIRFTCRIGGAGLPGVNPLEVDPVLGTVQYNLGTNPTFPGSFHHSIIYEHSGADLTLAVDMQVTTTAGSGLRRIKNRGINVFCLRS